MQNYLLVVQAINRVIFSLVTLLVVTQVNGQDQISLNIGDPAPEIKFSKWLKGTPVRDYKGERLYVLEFWATWCGPCIAAMPHLSELATKYKDQATFIGVNVMEKVDGKPYEAALPKVTRFVKSSANRMSYDVIVDNNAQDMHNLWLKPAGISGIPTTFIVKNGKIVWIGHPIKLDSVMDPIIAGTFDLAAYKKKYESRHEATTKMVNDMRRATEAVKSAAAAKDFDKAFQLVDESIKEQPILWMVMPIEKFMILLKNFPETDALNFAKDLIDKNSAFATVIAMRICETDSLTKQAYSFAAEKFRQAVKEEEFSLIYEKLAHAYSKAGDLKLAVLAQEKAIAAAKKEVHDTKYEGRVFKYTVDDYKKTLKAYKKTLKKSK